LRIGPGAQMFLQTVHNIVRGLAVALCCTGAISRVV